jgi:hypothetical protein
MGDKTDINIAKQIGREFEIDCCGGMKARLAGTPENLQIEVLEVGPVATGCFGRYVYAGKTYNLYIDAMYDDVVYCQVNEEEFEPTAGSSSVVICIEVLSETDTLDNPTIYGEIDS